LLNAENIDSRQSDDRDAVVTYKRVSAPRRPERSVVRAREEKIAPEPRLDAAEIYADRDEPLVFDFAAGDPHRNRADAIEDFIEDGTRSSWLRYGLVAGSLAVIAGVGILAATVGVATMLPAGPAQDSSSSGLPALALNSPNAAESASGPDNIREIPISSGAPETASRPEVVPPIPRPRPDEMLARVEPEPAAAEQPSIGSAPSIGANAPPPVSSEEAEAQPSASAPVTSAVVADPPANSGTDSLISNIEETLARIDASTSVEAAPSPPPQVQPQAQPPAAPPPVMMTQPVYPPPADIVPPPLTGGIDPSRDIAPPEVIGDGYQGYSTGPVPPEPVPDAYPQAPYLYPATPGVYPSDSYSFPPESIEETEAPKPGLLRRTLAKATGAVGRVFTRN